MSFSINWYSDGWGAFWGLVALGLLLLVLLLNGARKCGPLAGLLPMAIVWHLVVLAYYAFFVLPYYGDVSDARGYHEHGIEVASMVRDFDWSHIDWGLSTSAMNVLTGFMYAPFGADTYGISFFSAVLGFGGCLYYCRAFSLWATPKQARRYSLIVLFMPSLGMWTGMFGKDSWVALGLGLSAYGYSAMQKFAKSRGTLHFVGGLVITGVIRPHIALVLVISMAAAYLWGMTQNIRGSAPMKLLRIVVLVAMVGGLYPVALNFVGLSSNASAGVMEDYMQKNSAANAEAGGSVVDVQMTPGILGAIRAFPRGVVRVLLEPFPWEIRNLNSALAALENLFIAFFLFRNIQYLQGLFRAIVRTPYLLFSGFLTLGLLVMFTFLPNLGLLSRERVQLMPFLFAILVAAEHDRRQQYLSPIAVTLPQMAGYSGGQSNARIG